MKVKSKDEAQVGTNLGETDAVSVDAISMMVRARCRMLLRRNCSAKC